MTLNWNNIRIYNGSQDKAFEELVCQLAHKEENPLFTKFIRKGTPDAGVECFWILSTGKEWGWQAKWFPSSLDDSQWNQITKSIKTTLEKHPNIEKYYVAMPIDPPDARIEGQQSLLEKWNLYCEKWKKIAEEKSIKLDIQVWWSSDIIEKLQKKGNEGLTYFWFSKEEFSQEWLKNINDNAIEDLGSRYTPEINFNSYDGDVFNYLLRNKMFAKTLVNHFDEILNFANKINKYMINNSENNYNVTNAIEHVYIMLDSITFNSIYPIPIDKLLSLFETLSDSIVNKIAFLSKELQETIDYDVSRFQRLYQDLIMLLQSDKMQLINKPFLLLYGEAGIGKSHILADFVKNCHNEDIPCLFLLGQHFTTTESPWNQIKNRLEINCKFCEFLGAVNSLAEAKNCRFYIIIDALNEGLGKQIWINNILGFINEIQKYPRIGCVFSIRNTYLEITLPEKISDIFIKYELHGFSGSEYEASKFFFDNYGIEYPKVPILNPEFHNPLFLHLFCKSLKNNGYTEIPKGLEGITSILELLVISINTKLSSPNEFDYDRSYNLVQKIIDKIIEYEITNKCTYINYDTAFEIIEDLCTKVITKKGKILEALISEGLFIKNINYKKEEIIYFSFERYEDHLITKYLLKDIDNIQIPISSESTLYSYFCDRDALWINKGIIDALAIQIPERYNKEIFEVVPVDFSKLEPVYDSFIDSFLWRKPSSCSLEKTLTYLNTVFKYYGVFEHFMDNIISITNIPNHPFNAKWLYKILDNKSLSERDEFWTLYINENCNDNSSIQKLIDWAWNESHINYISEETRELSAITLCWFLASSNRKLRDSTTKALISLLRNHLNILVRLLDLFVDVTDPYISERLFCVIYGCVLQSCNLRFYKELCQKIYSTIFDKEKVYPNILLRDYARNIIEYAVFINIELEEIDLKKIRPPYKSDFPKSLPSNEEIDKLDPYKNRQEYNKEDSCIYNILSSMATEHGRTMYGDFGRYVFQSAISQWDVNANLLSNYAISLIFNKYGYSKDLFGNFDSRIGSGRGRYNKHLERIGKKYQWLALYEILAIVSDHYPKSDKWHELSEEEKKYHGTWDPFIRDIDPSYLIKNTNRHNDEAYYLWAPQPQINWLQNNDEWIFDKSDLPDITNLISLNDNKNEEWFLLEAYPSWHEPRRLGNEKSIINRKEIWYHIRSCLVSCDCLTQLQEFALKKETDIRFIPETSNCYEIFNKEYYWSPAFRFFEKDYYGLQETFDTENISSLYMTAINYLWEDEYDYSKEESISIVMPTKIIFEKMKLKFSQIPGEFTNSNGKIICFDPSVKNDSKSSLYILKKDFLNFLKTNNLSIMWTINGEKDIPTLGFEQDKKILHIKGIAYLDNHGKVVVNCSYKKEIIKKQKPTTKNKENEYNAFLKELLKQK